MHSHSVAALVERYPRHILHPRNDPFGEKKTDSEFTVVAWSAHGDSNLFSGAAGINTNFERLFHTDCIRTLLERALLRRAIYSRGMNLFDAGCIGVAAVGAAAAGAAGAVGTAVSGTHGYLTYRVEGLIAQLDLLRKTSTRTCFIIGWSL